METECDSAARQRSHEPQKADLSSPAKSKLVMVLGGVSATAMASLLSSAQATPALADMLTKGSTPATLRLLAQIALARSAAAILLLPAIGRLADRYGRKVVLMYTALATAVGHGMTAAFPSAFTLILG
jgi:MFS family permease